MKVLLPVTSSKSMCKSNKIHTEFNLTGTIKNVWMKENKPKFMTLQTSVGLLLIKFSKAARMVGISNLIPGNEVQVKGQKKQDVKTGKIKLKAEQILLSSQLTSTLTPLFCQESQKSASEDVVFSSPLSVQTSNTAHVLYSPIQEDCETSEIYPSVIPDEPVKQPVVKPAKILICQKSDCRKRGGDEICSILQQELAQRGLEDQVTIQKTGCLKKCKAGPNLVMLPDKTRYSKVEPQKIPALIDQHF